jgi:hypothetical protein
MLPRGACRYTRLLAPSLQVFNDDRVRWRPPGGSAGAGGGGGTVIIM